uniref:Uncharacterized protein n=1 Tax=Wuchereria bancrofti TaxID=6293 RepID=A0AAF5Q6S9_WUCBA
MHKSKIDFDELISGISDSETAEPNTSDEQQNNKEIDTYCNKLQESVNKEIDRSLQLMYDHCRAHYLVLFRNKHNPELIIILNPLCRGKILFLKRLSTKNDFWSCGEQLHSLYIYYLALIRLTVAFIIHLLLGINPAKKFIMQIIKMDRHSCKVIANGLFGQ